MEMRRTDLGTDTWAHKRRDKAEMAWRHRSHNEKILLKVIAFLVFALTCFIITVTVMDITYKAKIKDLEDQLEHRQSSTTEALTSHTSTLASTLTSLSSTTPPPTTTTTAAPPTTTTPSPTTTPAPSTTPTTADPTTIPPQTAEAETTHTTGSSLLLEALQSLLQNFSGITSASDRVDSSRVSKGLYTRTRGTFLLVADVRHERSRLAPTNPALGASNATESFDTPLVYIDEPGNSTEPPQSRERSETRGSKEDDLYDTDDDDYAGPRHTTTSNFNNDLEALSTKEGSGVDEDKMTMPP
ncbi:uncharacterized protein LOC134777323 isoform X2 [Penaeus indicus]|uniref:uncharacterized protein LOC134777323 isoform X2 n=1 Tax=Penaeus indicus TaxID=29960 RepID=UPI00300C87F3